METIKKIKVLIIDEEKDNNLSLSKSISEILSSLGVEVDFHYANEYDYVSRGLRFWGFKVICASAAFCKSTAFLNELLDYTLEHHGKILASFFISSNQEEVRIVKESGFKLSFLKDEKLFIGPEDSVTIKQCLLATGKFSYQVPRKNLVKPVCIFSQTYADSTPSERLAEEFCNDVALKLNKNQINYSVFDPAGFCIEISVEETDVSAVRIISETDDFWKEWVKRYLN